MDFMTSALIVSWLAILVLALVVSGLIRQVHQLSTSMSVSPTRVGLKPGATAPGALELIGSAGGVLLFVSPGCRTCVEALDEAATWQADSGGAVLAISATAVPDTPVSTAPDRPDLFDQYDAIATPFAVIVDADGAVVRSEPVGSRTAVRDLLASAPNPARSA